MSGDMRELLERLGNEYENARAEQASKDIAEAVTGGE